MKQEKIVKEQYIQLVETFITALESGKSGTELEKIRKEIRNLSAQQGMQHPVENSTHIKNSLQFEDQKDVSETE